MNFYQLIVRPFLFQTDPEKIHNFSISAGQKFGKIKPCISAFDSLFHIKDEKLHQTIGGLNFENPIGLAAGYDKSGHAIPFLESLGFSHLEIGSVSAESSQGNPKPRLFRLPKDEAIIVHYGLQNDGAEAIANYLETIEHKYPLGINIVKTNKGIGAACDTEQEILSDYRKSTLLLQKHAQYLTFNMSCPNTEMGRDHFAEKAHIVHFLQMLAEIKPACPVFLKISPMGGVQNIEKYLEACNDFDFVSGFIFNLPPGKTVPLITPLSTWKNWPGAVSGKPVAAFLNNCLSEMYQRMDKNKYTLISAGGVFSAEDAYTKIKLGASLVQLLTGMIYQGPALVKKINKGLIQLLEADGFKHISEAVGTAI